MGERAKSAVAGLQKRLSDEVPVVRREALIALAEIGPDSQTAVEDILKILNEGDSSLRPIACFALGRIGAPSSAAVPQLQKMLKGRNPYEKSVAAWALVHIAPGPETIESAIPLLVAALHGAESPSARAEIAKTLGEIGGSSVPVKEALTIALKDPEESVRKAAESALKMLK
jgi:HEAT repeat protein